jgi:hypothetical protein
VFDRCKEVMRVIEELANALLPKSVKVLAAIVAGFGGTVLFGIWLL